MRTNLVSTILRVTAGAALAAATACNFPMTRPARDVPQEGAMDNARLQTLIEGVGAEIEGQPGYWTFRIDSRQVMVVTDTNADRMRIMTPVAEDEALTFEQTRTLLDANFDRALDARYATSQGYVWSAFIHPLSQLTESQFLDGVAQVVTLADTYGSSYTSTNLVFQGGQN